MPKLFTVALPSGGTISTTAHLRWVRLKPILEDIPKEDEDGWATTEYIATAFLALEDTVWDLPYQDEFPTDRRPTVDDLDGRDANEFANAVYTRWVLRRVDKTPEDIVNEAIWSGEPEKVLELLKKMLDGEKEAEGNVEPAPTEPEKSEPSPADAISSSTPMPEDSPTS